jgi:RNA polymerase sigma-19 factor, ECF subfamily
MSSNEAVSEGGASPATLEAEPRRREDRSRQFDDLVRNHHLELVRHVNRRVHSWSDAKDIVQQIWLNLFRSTGLSNITNLRAYLFKAARNSARDWNEKILVRQVYADEQPLRGPELEPSAEEVCEHRQDLECLLQQIGSLPPQCRMTLLLVRCEGLTLDEAAVRLGVKPESVKKSLQRAMKHLATAVPLGSLGPRGKSP